MTQGRLVVIDLKTGKATSVRSGEIVEHAQLGAYQAAVEAGAFAESAMCPAARRWCNSAPSASVRRSRRSRRWPRPTIPAWAKTLVRETARTMAASTFHAVVNKKCRNCPVRRACPVSGQGRQVTDDGGVDMTPCATAGPRFTPAELADLLLAPGPGRPASRPRSSPRRSRRCWSSPAPGSGKTETMAARVVWLVANDYVRPEQILGLTFTRKAAGELASRIRQRLAQLDPQARHRRTVSAGEPTVADLPQLRRPDRRPSTAYGPGSSRRRGC